MTWFKESLYKGVIRETQTKGEIKMTKVGDEVRVTVSKFSEPYQKGSVHKVERITTSWIKDRKIYFFNEGDMALFDNEFEPH